MSETLTVGDCYFIKSGNHIYKYDSSKGKIKVTTYKFELDKEYCIRMEIKELIK